MCSIDEFARTGRLWMRNILPDRALTYLDDLADLQNRPGARIPRVSEFGDVPGAGRYSQLINTLLPDAFATRLIAFNKTRATNWGVPWHQDRVIAVAEKHNTDGYSNWSNKSGLWHAEPPKEILQKMLFVRIHLDDNTIENGAMEIAVGSHHKGILPAKRAEFVANSLPTEVCTAQRGDVLVLNMLTLHRSLPTKNQTSRRVLRVDYANSDLPLPLQFATRR